MSAYRSREDVVAGVCATVQHGVVAQIHHGNIFTEHLLYCNLNVTIRLK